MADRYKVLDIFAGAGGLSLGFLQTGRFEITAAFENNKAAQETYKINHTGTVLYNNVLEADFDKLIQTHGHFDVIIGGPPCQGFSNANRQHNQLINMNNRLVKTYVEFINSLSPEAFLLENVKMLGSKTHRFFYSVNDPEEVKTYGSFNSEDVLIYGGDFGIPFEKLIINDCVNWPNIKSEPRHHIALRTVKRRLNKGKIADSEIKILFELLESFCAIAPDPELTIPIRDFLQQTKDLQYPLDEMITVLNIIEALLRLEDIAENKIIVSSWKYDNSRLYLSINSYTVIDYLNHELEKEYILNPEIPNAVDYGVPQNRERYIILGIRRKYGRQIEFPRKSDMVTNVNDAIADLYEVTPSENVEDTPVHSGSQKYTGALQNLRDSKDIYNHIITKSTPIAMQRFANIKQGMNFHSLGQDQKKNYADPSRTQNSIYLRLDENQPSATVTNVRKAMWIHPIQDRAISVREAARLQSFPDSFRFSGTKDQQYQQVGNAVPPMLAKALAESVVDALDSKPKP